MSSETENQTKKPVKMLVKSTTLEEIATRTLFLVREELNILLERIIDIETMVMIGNHETSHELVEKLKNDEEAVRSRIEARLMIFLEKFKDVSTMEKI